jgi:hypothetical protein
MFLFKSPLFRLTSCCNAERNMLFNDVDGERLMFDWFQKLWHWTIEPVPLLLALVIYFGLIFYSRWRYFGCHCESCVKEGEIFLLMKVGSR